MSSADLDELAVKAPMCVWACYPLYRDQQLRQQVPIPVLHGQITHPVIFLEASVSVYQSNWGVPQETLPDVTSDLNLVSTSQCSYVQSITCTSQCTY